MPEPMPQPTTEAPPTSELRLARSFHPFLSEVREGGLRLGTITALLIIGSVVVFFYSTFGNNTKNLLPLFISLTPASGPDGVLPEVRHGEVWRLLTPMFIHFGFIHIIFNMIWLKDIGSAVEHRDGAKRFVALVFVLALCSDLGQYFVAGPAFGGMSGVVYGLFGYVWLRSLLDPASGYAMPRQTVQIMVIWFVLCLMHFIPNVANAAHGFGLAAGAACGWLAARLAGGQRGKVVAVRF